MYTIENADQFPRNRVITCQRRSSAKFENGLQIGTAGGEERLILLYYSTTINSFPNTADKVKQHKVQIIIEGTLL